MVYRELGRTGIKVSEIGLGCEGFIGKDENVTNEMFRTALERGVNCMDLYSPNPDMHRCVGKTLHGKREQFILQAHLCSFWLDGQYKCTRDINEVKSGFEAFLKGLETDYIDIGMIHYVDSVDTWRNIVSGEVMKYALALKKWVKSDISELAVITRK